MKIEKVGQKDIKGKPRVELVLPECILGMAEVLTYGANKYKPNSWQNVKDAEDKYYGAIMRHLLVYRKGIKIDEETRLSHLKHVLTNAMFLLYLEEKNESE